MKLSKGLFIFCTGFFIALILVNNTTSSQQYYDSVVAKQFVLIDDNGKPRGGFGYSNEGFPIITLKNKKGNDLIYLVVDDNGPSLRLRDKGNRPRAWFTVDNGSMPAIYLLDKKQESYVVLKAFDDGGGRLMFTDKDNKNFRAALGYKNGKASLAIKGADKYSGAYITAYDNDGVHINIADSNLRSNLTLRSTDNELAMVMAAQKRTGLFYRASRGDVPNLAIIKGGEPIWKALPGAPAPASDLPDIVDLIK